MLLDFSTFESCAKTLDHITTTSLYEISRIAHKQISTKGYYSDDWIKDYINRDLFKDYSSIYTTFFHVTSLPSSKEIEKNGLQNLQRVLSTDNFLSNFLSKYHICFDVPNRKIHYNNEVIDLKTQENNQKFYRVFNRPE